MAHRSGTAGCLRRIRYGLARVVHCRRCRLPLVRLGFRELRARHAGTHRSAEEAGCPRAVSLHEKSDVCGCAGDHPRMGSSFPGTGCSSVRRVRCYRCSPVYRFPRRTTFAGGIRDRICAILLAGSPLAPTLPEKAIKPRIRVITLAVADPNRSLAFYRDGVGLPTDGITGHLLGNRLESCVGVSMKHNRFKIIFSSHRRTVVMSTTIQDSRRASGPKITSLHFSLRGALMNWARKTGHILWHGRITIT